MPHLKVLLLLTTAALLATAGAAAPPPPPAAAPPPDAAAAVLRLEDGTHLQMQRFPGPGRWAAPRRLFTAAAVRVACPPGRGGHAVYAGRSEAEVRAAVRRRDRAWCGWARALGGARAAPGACVTPVSPLADVVVAVAKPAAWFAGGGGGGAAAACTMAREEAFSTPRFLAFVLGAFVFWNAARLSASTPFRLAGGSLGFVALAAALAVVALARAVPHRRALAAAALVGGSAAAAAARLAFGAWAPAPAQLARSPLVLGYVLISSLTGLALTYYYNDAANVKVNTMLRVGLRGAGLAAAALAMPSAETGALAAAALAAARLAPAARARGWRPALRAARGELAAAGLPPAGAAAPTAPAGRRVSVDRARRASAGREPATPVAAPAAPAPLAAAAGAPPVSPLVERGMVLNEGTGRLVQIGKPTFKKLVAAGYVVDEAAGTLTPPGGAGGGSGGFGGGASGGRRRPKSATRSP
jgi:hypothetical protein